MLQTMRASAKFVFWILAVAFVGGFLFAEASGLLGRARVTPTTAIATVNGQEILYQQWLSRTDELSKQQEQQTGHALNQDEMQRVRDQAFNDLVMDILLQQEYRRRGITVTPDEIRQAAQYAPPPFLLQNPELQTEGQFDPQKYQRFLNSPGAKQSGLLAYLEQYYREAIPREKLFDQVASGVYVTDARLWQAWQDEYDSATVSFVALRAEAVPDSGITVSDDELRSFWDKHKSGYQRVGKASISLVVIPRTVTAADSAAARQHALQLRQEIVGGTPFDSVARRESADSGSAENGGFLGRGPRGRFVKSFEDAAYALRPGEISQPVLTPFGYHIIKVDSRNGDTIAVRHILVRVQQGDSSAAATDRRADSLANGAASTDKPAKFDSTAKKLGLPVQHLTVFEDQPATLFGQYVPSVSAWAFSGVKPGETSDLIDADNAYYLARLDSVTQGGVPELDQVKDEIRAAIVRQKKIDRLVPQAQQIVTAARSASLEQAASQRGLQVEHAGPFARTMAVPGLGRLNEAVGAAFGIPVGQIGVPAKTSEGVFVLRVDHRSEASRAAFEAQKAQQRQTVMQGLRRKAVQDFLRNLHDAARIKDRRKDVQEQMRGTPTES